MIRRVRDKAWNYLYKSLRYCVHLLRFWLAFIYSKRLKNVSFIGITGSAGKTTAKDLSANILRTAGECHSTPRSLNYPDGISQILLKVRPRHRFCVLEVSGGNPGDMDRPLRLFTPSIAVLTLIARDHFKAHKSLEAIAREKSKLIKALPAQGVAVLNIDDPLVRAIGESCDQKVIWVGETKGANLRLLSARSSWPEPLTLEVEYEGRVYQAKTGLHGKHLALSALSALGVGLAADISLMTAMTAIAEVKPAEGRMEVVSTDGDITFLRDDWKAPHWSFSAPLEFMAEAEAKRKILVIGTLSDYSLSASKLYPKVAKQALEVGDIVIFVGPHAPRAAKAKGDTGIQNLHAFSEIREAAAFLNALLEPGDLVLLKGSNKADHLVRLMYNTQKPVSCWVSRCGIQSFCGDCSKLYKPIPSNPATVLTKDNSDSTNNMPLAGHDSGRKVIIGLGNPGSKYQNTPHNAGYRLLDRMAKKSHGSWISCSEGLVCEINIAGETLSLFKPAAKINNSGPPTRLFLERIGANINSCWVVHDEMDLTLGQAKLKQGGGDAGHRGLKSVIASLGSSNIKRLRIGARRADDAGTAKTSVLRPLSRSDETALEKGIDRAIDILLRETAAPVRANET
ncbi:aminoacyl-tRNA hydrolase [Marinobacter orientalis]|uniref:Aminoacyl-tRNA hydrolase n=1 Tax=Marinobacter orientalis TaxID=1928859 RepID=A0A7Y0RCN4_9GAMM|nr:aminoacyl-tRNA hydrolase [Marinobacter orientalis]NMT63794.1 aminoacyl-tRNA hydrolase [Marinobacter orientalis]TGX49903.1 aminoacyl-tRNA hydrolase [Marinobacter orientalis]